MPCLESLSFVVVFCRRRTPGRLNGFVNFKCLSFVTAIVRFLFSGVVMIPTPVLLESEAHSNLNILLLLITIIPLLAMGPEETVLSDIIAYIPAPVCINKWELLQSNEGRYLY